MLFHQRTFSFKTLLSFWMLPLGRERAYPKLKYFSDSFIYFYLSTIYFHTEFKSFLMAEYKNSCLLVENYVDLLTRSQPWCIAAWIKTTQFQDGWHKILGTPNFEGKLGCFRWLNFAKTITFRIFNWPRYYSACLIAINRQ